MWLHKPSQANVNTTQRFLNDGFGNVVIKFASFEISTERKYWKVVYISGYIYEKFRGNVIIRSFVTTNWTSYRLH